MNWEQLTLADVRRLVAAIEQANPQAVRAIIDRMPADDGEHSRVTLGTLVKLLNQLNGKTVLSDEDLQLLNRPDEPVVVQPIFAKLLAACHFSQVSDDFTEDNLPLVDDYTAGPIEVVAFEQCIDAKFVLSFLDEKGFVPVGMRRALEWRAVNTESDEVLVIAGGINSNRHEFDVIMVPYFFGKTAKVDRQKTDAVLGNQCRYLVTRK